MQINKINQNEKIIHLHKIKMVAFAYTIYNGLAGEILTENLKIGENASEQVIPNLRKDYNRLSKQLKSQEYPLFLTEEVEAEHILTTHCRYYKEQLTDSSKTKAHQHHDHSLYP